MMSMTSTRPTPSSRTRWPTQSTCSFGVPGGIFERGDASLEAIVSDISQRCASERHAVDVPLIENKVHVVCAGRYQRERSDVDLQYIFKRGEAAYEALGVDRLSIAAYLTENRPQSGVFGVTVESALPSTPGLSVDIVSMLVTDHPGWPGEYVRSLLACSLLDFFISCTGSGAGAVAAKSVRVEPFDDSHHYSRFRLGVHFDLRCASALLQTPATHATKPKHGGFASALLFLHDEGLSRKLDGIHCARLYENLVELEDMFRAARVCLENSRADAREANPAQLLADIPGWLQESSLFTDIDNVPWEDLGCELYECAVLVAVEAINKVINGGVVPISSGKPSAGSCVIVEVPVSAPLAFAADPQSQPPCVDHDIDVDDYFMAVGAGGAVKVVVDRTLHVAFDVVDSAAKQIWEAVYDAPTDAWERWINDVREQAFATSVAQQALLGLTVENFEEFARLDHRHHPYWGEYCRKRARSHPATASRSVDEVKHTRAERQVRKLLNTCTETLSVKRIVAGRVGTMDARQSIETQLKLLDCGDLAAFSRAAREFRGGTSSIEPQHLASGDGWRGSPTSAPQSPIVHQPTANLSPERTQQGVPRWSPDERSLASPRSAESPQRSTASLRLQGESASGNRSPMPVLPGSCRMQAAEAKDDGTVHSTLTSPATAAQWATSTKDLLEKPRRNVIGYVNPWRGFKGMSLSELDKAGRVEDGFIEEVGKELGEEFRKSPVQWFSVTKVHMLATSLPEAQDSLVQLCGRVDPMCVSQGLVGDCWLISAIVALAEFEQPIRSVFRPHSSQLVSDVSSGLYELEMFDPNSNFQKTTVKVNDRVPCFRGADGYWQPCFATSKSGVELWPMLLEKGVAKLLGGYSKLNGNRAPLAFAMLTGETNYHVIFTWDPKSAPRATNHGDAEHEDECTVGDVWGEGIFGNLAKNARTYDYRTSPDNKFNADRAWERLRCAHMDGKVMICSFRQAAGKDDAAGQYGEHDAGDGLVAGHAYSLISVRQVLEQPQSSAPTAGSGKPTVHRLLQLRNPWGDDHEWTGPWSDQSAEWAEHPAVAEELNYGIGQRQPDGLFWMSWDDFRARIDDVTYSEASFTTIYGIRVTHRKFEAPGETMLWSVPTQVSLSKATDTESILFGVDCWHNLDVREPDSLQEHLSSFFDSFPADDLSGQNMPPQFRVLGVVWLSASKVHLLLRRAPSSLDDADDALAEAVDRSGFDGPVRACEVVDQSGMMPGVGSAWLVSAFAALARFQWPIRSVFAKCPEKPPSGTDGPYTLSLHDASRGFKKMTVQLNDRVPCFPRFANDRRRASGWRPCFMGALDRNLWPMLLEKGVAHVLGGYCSLLETGSAPLVWAVITGYTEYDVIFSWRDPPTSEGPSKPIDTTWGEGKYDVRCKHRQYKFAPKENNEHTTEWLWERLRLLSLEGRLVCCSFNAASACANDGVVPDVGEAESDLELDDDCLVQDYVYSILGLETVTELSQTNGNRQGSIPRRGGARGGGSGCGAGSRRTKTWQFVKLEGPWFAEWRGRWSIDSEDWTKHPQIKDALRGEGEKLQDGQFWMSWSDFLGRAREILSTPASLSAAQSSARPAKPAQSRCANADPLYACAPQLELFSAVGDQLAPTRLLEKCDSQLREGVPAFGSDWQDKSLVAGVPSISSILPEQRHVQFAAQPCADTYVSASAKAAAGLSPDPCSELAGLLSDVRSRAFTLNATAYPGANSFNDAAAADVGFCDLPLSDIQRNLEEQLAAMDDAIQRLPAVGTDAQPKPARNNATPAVADAPAAKQQTDEHSPRLAPTCTRGPLPAVFREAVSPNTAACKDMLPKPSSPKSRVPHVMAEGAGAPSPAPAQSSPAQAGPARQGAEVPLANTSGPIPYAALKRAPQAPNARPANGHAAPSPRFAVPAARPSPHAPARCGHAAGPNGGAVHQPAYGAGHRPPAIDFQAVGQSLGHAQNCHAVSPRQDCLRNQQWAAAAAVGDRGYAGVAEQPFAANWFPGYEAPPMNGHCQQQLYPFAAQARAGCGARAGSRLKFNSALLVPAAMSTDHVGRVSAHFDFVDDRNLMASHSEKNVRELLTGAADAQVAQLDPACLRAYSLPWGRQSTVLEPWRVARRTNWKAISFQFKARPGGFVRDFRDLQLDTFALRAPAPAALFERISRDHSQCRVCSSLFPASFSANPSPVLIGTLCKSRMIIQAAGHEVSARALEQHLTQVLGDRDVSIQTFGGTAEVNLSRLSKMECNGTDVDRIKRIRRRALENLCVVGPAIHYVQESRYEKREPLCAHIDLLSARESLVNQMDVNIIANRFKAALQWWFRKSHACPVLQAVVQDDVFFVTAFKDRKADIQNMVHIDFELGVCDYNKYMADLQELLRSFTSKHAVAAGRAADGTVRTFFNDFELISGVRLCAGQLCLEGTFDVPRSLRSGHESCSLLAQVDFVDVRRTIEQFGAPHFANMLCDALHVIAGVKPHQFTLLDMRPAHRGWTANRALQQPSYTALFEIQFMEDQNAPDLLRVYHAVFTLHGEAARQRWVDLLPFFSDFVLEAAPEVDMPVAMEQKLNVDALQHAARPEELAPRLRAHIDLADRWDGGTRKPPHVLARWAATELSKGVGIPRSRIRVTCVRVRGAHAAFERGLQQLCEYFIALESKKDERLGAEIESMADDAAWKSSKLRGYTIDFEITPDVARSTWHDEEQELLRVSSLLRKFHSDAIQRQIHMDMYVFDGGVQIDVSHKEFEQTGNRAGFEPELMYCWPQGLTETDHSHGATIVRGVPRADKRTQRHVAGHQLTEVLSAHLDIIARPDRTMDIRIKDSERNIRDMLAAALEKHFDGSHGTYFRATKVMNKHNKAEILASPERMRKLVHEMPDREPCECWKQGSHPTTMSGKDELYRKWERNCGGAAGVKLYRYGVPDLYVIVQGVRIKDGHIGALQTEYLRRTQIGVDSVQLKESCQGYTIDLQVMYKDTGAHELREEVLDHARSDLRKFTRHCAEKAWRKISPHVSGSDDVNTPFFRRFDLDIGVQIDSIQPNDLVERSMVPAGVLVTIQMTTKDEARGRAEANPDNPEFVKEFKKRVGFALGVTPRQIVDVKVFSVMWTVGSCQVRFAVETLAHRPATREVEALRLRLQTMQLQCVSGTSVWTSAFHWHRPVSVEVEGIIGGSPEWPPALEEESHHHEKAGTLLRQRANAEEDEIEVEKPHIFKLGDRVTIGDNNASRETHLVRGVGPLILGDPLRFSHPAGTPVKKEPADTEKVPGQFVTPVLPHNEGFQIALSDCHMSGRGLNDKPFPLVWGRLHELRKLLAGKDNSHLKEAATHLAHIKEYLKKDSSTHREVKWITPVRWDEFIDRRGADSHRTRGHCASHFAKLGGHAVLAALAWKVWHKSLDEFSLAHRVALLEVLHELMSKVKDEVHLGAYKFDMSSYINIEVFSESLGSKWIPGKMIYFNEQELRVVLAYPTKDFDQGHPADRNPDVDVTANCYKKELNPQEDVDKLRLIMFESENELTQDGCVNSVNYFNWFCWSPVRMSAHLGLYVLGEISRLDEHVLRDHTKEALELAALSLNLAMVFDAPFFESAPLERLVWQLNMIKWKCFHEGQNSEHDHSMRSVMRLTAKLLQSSIRDGRFTSNDFGSLWRNHNATPDEQHLEAWLQKVKDLLNKDKYIGMWRWRAQPRRGIQLGFDQSEGLVAVEGQFDDAENFTFTQNAGKMNLSSWDSCGDQGWQSAGRDFKIYSDSAGHFYAIKGLKEAAWSHDELLEKLSSAGFAHTNYANAHAGKTIHPGAVQGFR